MKCYRCGASLEALSLPLSRMDECPSCTVYLHVCRMCVFFDPSIPKQCREDDAEEVKVQDKERANFCDYFKPSDSAYDASFSDAENKAEGELATLFGDNNDGEEPRDDGTLSEADKLFK
jgi:hypothetical protein